MGNYWQERFDAVSVELSESFADKSLRHTDTAMMASLKQAGFAIQFKPTKSLFNALGAVVEENVSLIKSIPSKYLADVQGEVWRAVTSGYDLGTLTTTLQDKYGVSTFKRAATIARDQTNKAKAVIEAKRRMELGIKQAIWQHSGGGKEPRPAHVAAGRKNLVFDLDKGAYIDGEWIFPGELINCRCTSRMLIPGYTQ